MRAVRKGQGEGDPWLFFIGFGILKNMAPLETMTVDELKTQLEDEHFSEVWLRTEPPDYGYDEHTHPVDTVYIVITGQLITNTGGKEATIGPGERWDVPKNVPHSSRIGAEGCTYITGVRM